MPEFPLAEPSVTVEQFADRHQLCTTTVYRLIKAGEIPAYRIGHQLRIPESASASTAAAK